VDELGMGRTEERTIYQKSSQCMESLVRYHTVRVILNIYFS
jgi:hypothetical protein